MALVDCAECGRNISDKAMACPGCGYAFGAAETKPQATVVRNVVTVEKTSKFWKGWFVVSSGVTGWGWGLTLSHPHTDTGAILLTFGAMMITAGLIGRWWSNG